MDRLKPAAPVALRLAVGEEFRAWLRSYSFLGPSFDRVGKATGCDHSFDPPNWRVGAIRMCLDFQGIWACTGGIAACRELDVSYKLLDISGPDWLEVVDSRDATRFWHARPSEQYLEADV